MREPLHITLKLMPDLPSLRRKDIFKLLRESVRTARKKGFGVAHFAILSNHIHLILEPDAQSVRSPLQSVTISFAKRLNARLKRNGAVFFERYHLHVLKTPREVRNALDYVLTNEARHRARAHAKPFRAEITLDPFSSAAVFRNWKELLGSRVRFRVTSWSDDSIEAWYSHLVKPAHTWLLNEGWRRARGTPITS
jgi:REP element-mobilizing transposase RayT